METTAIQSDEPRAFGGDISDAGNHDIDLDQPYRVEVTITGDAPILFHRWQSDAVEIKAKAAKGSAAKKTDNVESYVWRTDAGHLAIPGEYLRGSLIDPRNGAAKYQQDPRSPRKSALDLFRAGVVAATDLATVIRFDGSKADAWDYLDRRRAVVQRSAVTRERPAIRTGWQATFILLVLTPAYIDQRLLHRTLVDAGRLVGIGDFRPTFGRFSISRFVTLED